MPMQMVYGESMLEFRSGRITLGGSVLLLIVKSMNLLQFVVLQQHELGFITVWFF